MRIKEMNWMQVEDYLKRDDRAVVPLGSTEQHAQLSLMVDCILSERVAADAAAPLGVPVFPPVNYGITPYFKAFPGTISLRMETYLRIIRDILDSLSQQGFRRIVFVNGHGGNSPAQTLGQEWMTDHPACALSSTIGGTRRRPGPRSRRSTRLPRTPPGWRTSPGRGWSGRAADPAEADGRFRQGARRQCCRRKASYRRWQFRRLLPALRGGDGGAMGRRRGRNPGADRAGLE